MTIFERERDPEVAAKQLMLFGGIGVVGCLWLIVNAPYFSIAVLYSFVGMIFSVIGLLGLAAWGMHGVLNPPEVTDSDD